MRVPIAEETRKMKKKVAVAAASAVILASGLVFAKPVRNVSGQRHPNLAAAQRLCQQAWDKLSAAQAANEFDMNGHAKKAKDLLEQANAEIKEAALAANVNK